MKELRSYVSREALLPERELVNKDSNFKLSLLLAKRLFKPPICCNTDYYSNYATGHGFITTDDLVDIVSI
jgi:hypothetical protein